MAMLKMLDWERFVFQVVARKVYGRSRDPELNATGAMVILLVAQSYTVYFLILSYLARPLSNGLGEYLAQALLVGIITGLRFYYRGRGLRPVRFRVRDPRSLKWLLVVIAYFGIWIWLMSLASQVHVERVA